MERVPADPSPAKKDIHKLKKPRVIRRPHPPANKKTVGFSSKDGKKNVEFDKKVNLLLQQKDKLQSKTEKLSSDLLSLRNTNNYTEQERDKLHQFLNISKRELENEKETTKELEIGLEKLRSSQAQHVTKLHQKMRCLILKSQCQRVACTQTDSYISPTGFEDANVQTVQITDKDTASNLLRQSDTALTSFIAELERDKMKAQSDLKYAVVQIEQRMKTENEYQLTRLRDEKDRVIQEISLTNSEQYRTMQAQHTSEVLELHGKIDYLQTELLKVRESNDDLLRSVEEGREKVLEQSRNLGRAETQTEDLGREVARLTEYKKSYQRDMRRVDDMRKETEKYKDINEIIMGEFKKLEKERDELLEELERGIKQLDVRNINSFSRIQKKIDKIHEKYVS